MEGIRFIDIYATKGIEYLIVIAFLAAFVLFCRYMYRTGGKGAGAAIAPESAARFRVPEGLYYHQGHGWLRPEPSQTGVVGLDDFAQKLIGRLDSIVLPGVGYRMTQGEKAWYLVVDNVSIPMLSPVDGEVVEVNTEALKSPEIVRQDPYGKGWLLKVRSRRIAADTKNLLSGKLARAWMENALEKLQPANPENLGPVLADGGFPVEGIARILGGDKWAELAKAHLMTEGD
jgi:glycine cleavage system H lipoate-binding protein